MSYASKYLTAYGYSCSILRTPAVGSYVSMKRSTKAIKDLAVRDAYWEGLILSASVLISGDIFQIGSDKYLVHSVTSDSASDELAWFAAKTNATVQHKRVAETVDATKGNISTSWTTITADVPAFCQIITYQLRQEDPGLLDSARYLFQVKKSIAVQKLDRIVYGGNNYMVVSIDDVGLSGVVILQLGVDTRP